MEWNLKIGRYTVWVFEDGESSGVVYIPLSREEAESIWALLPSPRPVLAAIEGVDWNRQLSPWPAPKAFGKGEDFAGEAEGFLEELAGPILRETEERLKAPAAFRGIAGYSLAGLFALWALGETDCFSRAASLSGSLWYDGFLEHLGAHPPIKAPERLFLSLGDREKRTKNLRMAQVETCTLQAAGLYSSMGVPVRFEQNPGGHFQDVSQRIARGIAALSGECFSPRIPVEGAKREA